MITLSETHPHVLPFPSFQPLDKTIFSSSFQPPRMYGDGHCRPRGNETRECVEICSTDGTTCKRFIFLSSIFYHIFLCAPFGYLYFRYCHVCFNICFRVIARGHYQLLEIRLLENRYFKLILK